MSIMTRRFRLQRMRLR